MTRDPESALGLVLMAVLVVVVLVAYHVLTQRREYARRLRRINGVWDRGGRGEAEKYALRRGWGPEFMVVRESRWS